jgi:hypothetical protein
VSIRGARIGTNFDCLSLATTVYTRPRRTSMANRPSGPDMAPPARELPRSEIERLTEGQRQDVRLPGTAWIDRPCVGVVLARKVFQIDADDVLACGRS